MAYIQQNDELMQNGQAPDTSYPQAQVQTSGASTDVGSGSGGVSTAGVGAGGTGGWTNIQAYLKANQGDTGSAQALSKAVGSQFDQEKNALSQNAQDFLGNAKKQVDDNNISYGQADDLINQGSQLYKYQPNPRTTTPAGKDKGDVVSGGGPLSYDKVTQGTPERAPLSQDANYTGLVNKVQGALTNQYSGPTSYNYGFSAPTQQYAQGLKDNGGFDQLMNGIYSQSAGKPLSAGQFQLQKQLDVNNEGLTKARQDLLNKYAGLEGERDNTVQGTTGQLSSLAQQYRDNQTNLRDYLDRKANDYLTQESQAEADARAAYMKDFTTDHSGRANSFRPAMLDYQLERGGGTENMADRGVWGDRQGQDLTWQELQREQDLGNKGLGGDWNDFWYGAFANPRFTNTNEGGTYGRFLGNRDALNEFYNVQDSKYADTGDAQKRAYNTVLDFLNSAAARKEQGFKVRG